MSLLSVLRQLRAGYPGEYKSWVRGSQPVNRPPQFTQPTDPRDRRSRIPALGYPEYWYPALPAKDVGWKKPSVLRMLGKDLAFFRDTKGEVKALWDGCPHRGMYLSRGDCFYQGFLTCPYHGATFDGDGNCVAFLTEGPDSKMVGELKARAYPTVTLKGMVFVWMGEGEPVDPREDLPPELFEEHSILRPSFYRCDCNWIIALENTQDAHNAFMVHRNSINVMLMGTKLGGRPRTPLGYRTQIVNNKTAYLSPGDGKAPTERYYYDENGNIPYQMYYPGVNGVWPLTKWRLTWTWINEWRLARQRRNRTGRFSNARMTADEWHGTRLPGFSRTNGADDSFRSTRWPVPVEENLTRMVCLNVDRFHTKPNPLMRVWCWLNWPVRDWSLNYNFRMQDVDIEKYCQYGASEHLSSTDSTVIAVRKLFTEHARGVKPPEPAVVAEELGETMVRQGDLRVLKTAKGAYADEIRKRMGEG